MTSRTLQQKADWAAYMRQYKRERTPQLKAAIVQALGGQCQSCGITDPRLLAIDHVNGGGAKERKGKSSYMTYLTKVLREVDGGEYRILCMNCNWLAYLDLKG